MGGVPFQWPEISGQYAQLRGCFQCAPAEGNYLQPPAAGMTRKRAMEFVASEVPDSGLGRTEACC